MGIIYWMLIVFIGFGTVAMMIQEGLWSNTITLFSMVLAGLTAFALFEPVTVMADEATDGEYTYVLDLVVLWFIYFLTITILKTAAQSLSGTKLIFNHPIDQVASPIVALITAYLMVGFVIATLHVSPLSRRFVRCIAYGAKPVPKDTLEASLEPPSNEEVAKAIAEASPLVHPDLGWLYFTELMLGGARFGPGEDGFSDNAFLLNRGLRRDQFTSSGAKWLRVSR